MAESAEQVHARMLAAAGEDGRLPMPAHSGWDSFPWEVVDGRLAPRVLPPPADEPPRAGETPERPCPACDGVLPEEPENPGNIVWEDEAWRLKHLGRPSGLPLVLILEPKEHVDFGRLDDEMAAQHGQIANRLVRVVEGLDHVARCHVLRYGDGTAHAHTWFVARTARLSHVIGSAAIEWDDVIPPGPEDVWRADLHAVASKLANWGGEARA